MQRNAVVGLVILAMIMSFTLTILVLGIYSRSSDQSPGSRDEKHISASTVTRTIKQHETAAESEEIPDTEQEPVNTDY